MAEFYLSGREIAARGPLNIPAGARVDLARLREMGIGLDAAFAADAALTGPASGATGAPYWQLQNWLPGIIRQITRIRAIDELAGVLTSGSWSDEEIIARTSEMSGSAELYGDAANIPLANYKAGYERRSVVRFELGFMITKLDEEREARAGISASEEKRASVARALDIARNRVGFYGFNAPDTRCFGFLNDPNLPAYSTLPNGAGGTPTWSTKTFLEITADLRRGVVDLINRSQGNFRPDRDNFNVALPLGYDEYLGVTSDFGVSVRDWFTKTYSKGRFTSAPELNAANGGANVMYMYAESIPDSGTDDEQVIIQVVPSRLEMVGVENRAKGRVEDFTNATAGCVVKRPYAVVRYSGL